MKNNYLLIALALFVGTSLLSGCKKQEQTCQLGKVYNSDGNVTPNPNVFSYYDNGNLQKIVYTDNSSDTLAYSNDSLYLFTYNSQGVLVATLHAQLNGSGYITTGAKTLLDNLGNTLGTTTYTCQYNAEGNLTQLVTLDANGTTTQVYTYDNGNRKEGMVYTDTTISTTYSYYHNSAENKTGINDEFDVFTPYLGKASKNLLDSIHVIANNDTTRILFNEKLDANGYLNSATRTYLPITANTRYFTFSYINCAE